jgi:hypothetical protein
MRCKWLCVLMFAGCVSDPSDGSCEFTSATYRLEGEVRIAKSADSFAGEAVTGPLIIQAFEDSSVTLCTNEVIAQTSPGRKLGELALNEVGEFELELSVEVYSQVASNIDLMVLLDANDDGLCNPGELWTTTKLIADDHDRIDIELRQPEACPSRF